MILTLIAFIVVLGVLVLVHEAGHFFAAKMAKVKVLEFAIGFPPRIATFKKGETKYVIGLLPFGGYVNMLGEDETSKDPRAYNNQTPGKRFMIGIAGVVMNLVLAWILLSIGFMAGMTPIATPSDQIPWAKEVKSQIFVADIVSGSAADKAGLKPGDQIVSADGTVLKSLDDLSKFTSANTGKAVNFQIKENDANFDKQITLGTDKSAALGVGIIDQAVVRVTWYRAPIVALRECYETIKYTFLFLESFIKQLFTTATLSDQVGGPVAIYNMSGAAARMGVIAFLQFIAVLSLNLALINILPFPALDGGRAFFIILEKIFGKRILKEEVEGLIHTIGFALLILLVLAVTYKDIMRLIHK